jgi:2-dehydro-3-deoxyphosphogluconate aldolase / (4S)-4-hydroxy-2-oxoglutarate aldolase
MTSLTEISPVLPLINATDPGVAVHTARALAAGGIGIVEVALAGGAAGDAIRAIADQVPETTVGAGTVCSAEQVKLAVDAGARFVSTPGSTDRLLDALLAAELPFLAGVATPSDMLRLLERGVTTAKLFPAGALGGPALLRALHPALPELRFCAVGGITVNTAPEYLAVPNVDCVGGTWLTPRSLVDAAEWDAISRLAARAAQLRR